MKRTDFIKGLFGLGIATTLPNKDNDFDLQFNFKNAIEKWDKNMQLVWQTKNLANINQEVYDDSKHALRLAWKYFSQTTNSKYDSDLIYSIMISNVKFYLLCNEFTTSKGQLSIAKNILKNCKDKDISNEYYEFTGKSMNDAFIRACKDLGGFEDKLNRMKPLSI